MDKNILLENLKKRGQLGDQDVGRNCMKMDLKERIYVKCRS
jgi:hypothetical protein